MALRLPFPSLIVLAMLMTPAAAQSDQYWQQLYGNALGQCGASLVNLAKQLDDAKKELNDVKKQLADLQKRLDELKNK